MEKQRNHKIPNNLLLKYLRFWTISSKLCTCTLVLAFLLRIQETKIPLDNLMKMSVIDRQIPPWKYTKITTIHRNTTDWSDFNQCLHNGRSADTVTHRRLHLYSMVITNHKYPHVYTLACNEEDNKRCPSDRLHMITAISDLSEITSTISQTLIDTYTPD